MSRQISSLLAIAAVCVTLTPTSALAQAPKKAVDCAQVKCVALTFDDGPGKYAGKLLDTLKKYDVKATFFLEGQYVKSRPSYVKRMVAEGHELGNHSYTHPDFRKVEKWDVRAEIKKTQEAVKKAAGVEPKLLRPPYGMVDLQVSDVATEFGMPIILWTGGNEDWSSKNATAIKKKSMEVAKPGSIVLMHDWVKQTVDSMPSIVKSLKKKGYHLVTVSEVLKGQDVKLEPGDVYPVPAGWENK
ncbi:polysaccharide deacetylase family protein [Nonomuraea mesophila]|uniref:Polysaccharide deacetylase family protein n=1 Tax=Nonomuraea mesophila TaxID=2530382 RepID=A0A4V2Z5I9_9ACTN|nr:polysaccharide deacetylase family protein [Nonomuraea mesophila]TDE23960.1 polysaccharide deacetylase family protein [Nonomuraea mesophila]